MHPVVLHSQGGKLGTFAFAGFDIHQNGAGVLADGAQLVQLFAITRRDHAAVANQHGRIVDHCAAQQLHLIGELADALNQFVKAVGAGQGTDERRQGLEAGVQAGQVARARRAQGHPAENPFHVTDVIEYIAGGLETPALPQGVDLVLALGEGGAVA